MRLRNLLIFLVVAVVLFLAAKTRLQANVDSIQLPADRQHEEASGALQAEPSIPARQEEPAIVIDVSERIDSIPILMYHEFGEPQGPYPELFLDIVVFGRQMQYLADNFFSPITLKDLYSHWTAGTPLPENPIVLTFDDGYSNVYSQAFPVMQEHSFTGVLFLFDSFSRSNHMTVQEAEEMLQYGFEIGSHTKTHPDLRGLSAERLRAEVVDFRGTLEELFGTTVTSFSYPAGRFNEAVLEATEEAGFDLAVTTVSGRARLEQGNLQLKRIGIYRSDGFNGFVSKLNGIK